MSKPIFIVRIPVDFAKKEGVQRFEEVQRQLQAKLNDYHVLALVDSSVEALVFECFNSDDAEQKNIQEIREMILNSLEIYKN